MPQNLSWAEAQTRAQQRIADLANRRTLEARNARDNDILGSRLSRVTTEGFGNISERINNGNLGKPAFRVGQLDTELLDEELLDLLKGHLWSGFKYFNVCISCRSLIG